MDGGSSKEGVHPSAGRYCRRRGGGGTTVGPDGASVCRGGASRFNRGRGVDSSVNYGGVDRGSVSRAPADRWDGNWRGDAVSRGRVNTWRGDAVGHGGVTGQGDRVSCGGVGHGGITWRGDTAGSGGVASMQEEVGRRHPEGVGSLTRSQTWQGQAVGRTGIRAHTPGHVEGGFQTWRDDAGYSGYSKDGSLRSRGDQAVQDVESSSRHRGVRAGDCAVQSDIGLGVVEGAAFTDAYAVSGQFYVGSIKVNEETNLIGKQSPQTPICAAPYSPPHIDSHWRARNSPVPDEQGKANEEYIKRKEVLEGLYGWETTYILLKLIKESPEAALLFDKKIKELKAKMDRISTLYEAYPTLSEQLISEEFAGRYSAKILDVTTVPRKSKYNKALVEFKTKEDMDDFLKRKELKKFTDCGEFQCVQLQNKCFCKIYPVNSTADYEWLSDELRITIMGPKSVLGEEIYQFFMEEFDNDVALGPTDLSKLDGKLMGYSHLYFCHKETVKRVLARKVFYIGKNKNQITVFPDDASADEETRTRRVYRSNALDPSRTSSEFSHRSVCQEVLNFEEEGGPIETPDFYLDGTHAGALTRAALPYPYKSARKRARESPDSI